MGQLLVWMKQKLDPEMLYSKAEDSRTESVQELSGKVMGLEDRNSFACQRTQENSGVIPTWKKPPPPPGKKSWKPLTCKFTQISRKWRKKEP